MGPRIFGIPATRAPVVAVVRRGPTRWSHLGRWDVATGRYEPGAWIAGNLYPQRCDLSPDGRWFAYFALKGAARWKAGPTYIAISRLPWLRALAAWRGLGPPRARPRRRPEPHPCQRTHRGVRRPPGAGAPGKVPRPPA